MVSNALQAELDDLADEYLELHQRKENLFWTTKMGLSDDHGGFQKAEVALRQFLGDVNRLSRLRELRERADVNQRQKAIIDGWIEMLKRNAIENPDQQAMLKELIGLEGDLEKRRREMELGYVDPASEKLVRATSVVLGNMVRSDPDEARRKAAWNGLNSIGDFVLANGLCETVIARNRYARKLGYVDYYDYKVQWAEGFDKKTLFGMLDDLEQRTADKVKKDLKELASQGEIDGSKPWNYNFMTSGSLAAEKDPYFRFEDSLERWGRSFAALGIKYRQAKLTLDLIDRQGKYENGFMHGPTPAFNRRGEWLPAEINFTSNAVPDHPGSGMTAMRTLFHEGGHAAHFANIVTDAPCFSQEFAPTSVAFAETQSMFLDSLMRDAAWQRRYAKDKSGKPIPFELIERSIALSQPTVAFEIRRMLSVCYFEKALYELPEAEVTAERVREVCRDVERKLLFFEEGSPRPTMSVPHILSGESSCYYHGYVLAQMAVEQTREHFLDKYGHIVDNPLIGPELAEIYWRPGNAVPFLDYINGLTGKPLSADALVHRANLSAEEAIRREHDSVKAMAEVEEFTKEVSLDVNLSIIHGPETVVASGTGFDEAARRFRDWVTGRWSVKS